MSSNQTKKPKFKPSNPDDFRTEASLFALEQAQQILDRMEQLEVDKILRTSVSRAVNESFAAQENKLTSLFIEQLEQIRERSSDPLSLKYQEAPAKKTKTDFFNRTGHIWFFLSCILSLWLIFDINSYIFS